MKPIPAGVVAELHDALKHADVTAEHAGHAGHAQRIIALKGWAGLEYQAITARALVTLLASLTDDREGV